MKHLSADDPQVYGPLSDDRTEVAIWASPSYQTLNAVEGSTVLGWMNEFYLSRRKVRVRRCFHTRKFYLQRESFGRVLNDLMKSSFEYKPPGVTIRRQ
jgi:hypothetical protein